jgi:hypothetical protein
MPAANWFMWMALSGVAAAAVLWHYRQRETPGRGRLLLSLLRVAALVVLLLLLFNPELPGTGAAGPGGTHVLLDASLSMEITGPDGRTGWEEGAALARSRAGTRAVLLFGDQPRSLPAALLPEQVPGDARSRLLPALQAAAEAGARRVIVITDGRLEDADAVARWASRLGVEILPEVVGAEVANRSLVEVSAPSWAEADAPIRVEFGVAGTAADSIRVVARSGGRVVGRTAVAAAGAGRLSTGSMDIRVPPPAGGGWVAVELALEATDAVPDDDQRTFHVHVAEQPAGIALVSFRPDWEPRFLAPVLEQALGLPVRGYIRGATGQYVRLGGGLDAGAPATDADVRGALQRAELVVIHGAGLDLPDWAVSALGSARQLLVFPADGADALPLPVTVGPLVQGDYFPSAAIPASPVAPLLAGQELAGTAPLSGMRSAELPPGAWAALLATRGRQGAPQPALVAGESGGRRWAVALGAGYWQWAFRGGAERTLYARLWSAVGGWLVRERALAGVSAVRPAQLAAPRGVPVAWVARGLAADSIAVQLRDANGTVVLDTVITMTGRDSASMAAPAPGSYTYRARAFSNGTVTESAGPLTVERFSPEFAMPRVDMAALQTPPAAVRTETDRRGGTPLHATAYPYILIVLLLATEWILRRRWGLR